MERKIPETVGQIDTPVDVMEKLALERIGKTYKIELERREPPTDEDVQKVVAQRMTALLESRLRTLDNVQLERLSRYEALTATLNGMLLDDVYKPTLQSAPAAPVEKQKNERPEPRPRGRRPSPRAPKPTEQGEQPREQPHEQPREQPREQAREAAEQGEDKPKPKRRRRPRRRRKKKPSEGGGEPNGNTAE